MTSHRDEQAAINRFESYEDRCCPTCGRVNGKHPLIGKWFHSWVKNEKHGGRSEIELQGKVLSEIEIGKRYLVQLFSWWDGSETNQEIVSIVDGKYTFYSSNEDMRDSYRRFRERIRE